MWFTSRISLSVKSHSDFPQALLFRTSSIALVFTSEICQYYFSNSANAGGVSSCAVKIY